MADQYLSWNPVPPEFNRLWALGVEGVEERKGPMQTLTVVLIAPRDPHAKTYSGLHVWRITFDRVLAYRLRQYGWPNTLPLERPPGHDDLAAWEVWPSSWLAESIPLEDSDFETMHHYVLVNFSEVYDVAAAGCHIEQLPDRSNETAEE